MHDIAEHGAPGILLEPQRQRMRPVAGRVDRGRRLPAFQVGADRRGVGQPKSSSCSTGILPVGLSCRQFGGGFPGMTGTTGTSSIARPLSRAATSTLRVCTEIGTP
jgi:hypothetical protein